MPSKSANVRTRAYEALKDKGMSKERAQDRQHAGRVQEGRQGLGPWSKLQVQGGTTAQKKAGRPQRRKGGRPRSAAEPLSRDHALQELGHDQLLFGLP